MRRRARFQGLMFPKQPFTSLDSVKKSPINVGLTDQQRSDFVSCCSIFESMIGSRRP